MNKHHLRHSMVSTPNKAWCENVWGHDHVHWSAFSNFKHIPDFVVPENTSNSFCSKQQKIECWILQSFDSCDNGCELPLDVIASSEGQEPECHHTWLVSYLQKLECLGILDCIPVIMLRHKPVKQCQVISSSLPITSVALNSNQWCWRINQVSMNGGISSRHERWMLCIPSIWQ